MERVLSQIVSLTATKTENDLKKLKDFLRSEQENLRSNAAQVDQALGSLDMVQHSLGIAFLLNAQLSAGVYQDQRTTFAYVGNYLKAADELQVKKVPVPFTGVCKSYAQMAIDFGQQAMMQSLRPLRMALEKVRPDPETLTAVHTSYLRVCLKVKAYHLGSQLLEQPIFDVSQHASPALFLSYFYYGAMIRIGMKEYAKALQLLLVALTCPASCLSAIQADAYKKYALLCLKVDGEPRQLPSYASSIMQRYAKGHGYTAEITEAFKEGDLAALNKIVQEKAQAIEADSNMGLVKQVVESLQRHKVRTLTKTYLTLSLREIARELNMPEEASSEAELEALLFDMVAHGEIIARIDNSTGNVSFEDDDGDDFDVAMVEKLQTQLQKIPQLAGRLAAFEREVVSSEAYIRKTAALEGERGVALGAHGGYDLMDF
eukprot:TRINITY_DN81855_c0_g1_i1.p1 TRINITY_DN81855_c0_g1~~TRINITY_DN81855_c0_g1_i1.p1  ORF type:complete len:431 (-),score=155.91 TRINITY_DN81855_c0_g1_i1:122-1414(-)